MCVYVCVCVCMFMLLVCVYVHVYVYVYVQVISAGDLTRAAAAVIQARPSVGAAALQDALQQDLQAPVSRQDARQLLENSEPPCETDDEADLAGVLSSIYVENTSIGYRELRRAYLRMCACMHVCVCLCECVYVCV